MKNVIFLATAHQESPAVNPILHQIAKHLLLNAAASIVKVTTKIIKSSELGQRFDIRLHKTP